MSKREREEYLKADEWTKEGSVQQWEVVCAGCNKHITLEKPRSDAQMVKGGCEFYPGNWNKHRNGCAEVYRKWCEQNGWEADEGMEEEIQESREGKSERNEGGKAFTDACHWPARVIGFDTGKCCYIAICIAVL